ncbi:hypothetical protein A3Q56_04996 [Intoshia linei]|uniref:Uncharacterized protein n=1 Tax=Intoshia linei TaxID=1819745 RepID=A0A177AZ79_9BILA|nr:hypothetical protein A3Q56_04996 [Intoshia linei]
MQNQIPKSRNAMQIPAKSMISIVNLVQWVCGQLKRLPFNSHCNKIDKSVTYVTLQNDKNDNSQNKEQSNKVATTYNPLHRGKIDVRLSKNNNDTDYHFNVKSQNMALNVKVHNCYLISNFTNTKIRSESYTMNISYPNVYYGNNSINTKINVNYLQCIYDLFLPPICTGNYLLDEYMNRNETVYLDNDNYTIKPHMLIDKILPI